MNIYQSMLSKKNQKILSDICTYIDSYTKAKHGRKPVPEIITINGVKICSR